LQSWWRMIMVRKGLGPFRKATAVAVKGGDKGKRPLQLQQPQAKSDQQRKPSNGGGKTKKVSSSSHKKKYI
jgi:hypothetical protein